MFRRWKENGRKALLTMQAAVLSGMMTICSYAETVQDANWMPFYGSDHEGTGCIPKRLFLCDCGGSGTFCTVVYLCRRKTVIW